MIRKEIQEFRVENVTEISDHWKMRNIEPSIDLPKTSRIIPIGDGYDKFRKMILQALRNAQETIMLCSFILSDKKIIEEIIKATEREVRCYLLFSTEAQLKKEYKIDKSNFDRESLELHIKMLDQLVGKALARTNEHLHAKYLLIDYGTVDQKGFFSTANFTYEALTRNQELGIILNNSEIVEFFDFFRLGFWRESSQELVRTKSWDNIRKEDINERTSYLRTRITTPVKQNLREEINSNLNANKGPVFVASYGFDENHEITKLISSKAQKNETVILTRPREKNIPTIKNFISNKVIILSYEYIHAKFVFAPQRKFAIVMTANIEPRGMDEGYEIGVILDEQDLKELEQIVKYWLKQAPYKWIPSTSVQNLEEGLIKIPNQQELVEKEIREEIVLPPHEENPTDLFSMQKLIASNFKVDEGTTKVIAKVYKQTRIINPPQIPIDAREIKADQYWQMRLSKEKFKEKKIKKFPIKIYKLKKRYYGEIKSWKEFEKVKDDPSLPNKLKFVTVYDKKGR